MAHVPCPSPLSWFYDSRVPHQLKLTLLFSTSGHLGVSDPPHFNHGYRGEWGYRWNASKGHWVYSKVSLISWQYLSHQLPFYWQCMNILACLHLPKNSSQTAFLLGGGELSYIILIQEMFSATTGIEHFSSFFVIWVSSSMDLVSSFPSDFLGCVCVCGGSCLHVYGHICTCVPFHVETGSWHWVSSFTTLYFVYWGILSLNPDSLILILLGSQLTQESVTLPP